MKYTYLKRGLTSVIGLFMILISGTGQASKATTPMIPQLASDYVHIYKPQADVFSAENTQTYISGHSYDEWIPNEHSFIKGPKGHWHCFGVTKPLELPDQTAYEAEGLLTFHALAPEGTLEQAFLPETWVDQAKFSIAGSGFSPHALKSKRTYTLISSSLGKASSKDLHNWMDNGSLEVKGGGKDPHILYVDGTYYLVRSDGRSVNLVTSTDFVNWTDPIEIFEAPEESWQCESPTLLRHKNKFYLFWCLRDISADREKLLKLYKGHNPKNYDYRTFVYVSDTPTDFFNREPITRLSAHAPEIIQDEKGNYFISSADYPRRGVNLARLKWKAVKQE